MTTTQISAGQWVQITDQYRLNVTSRDSQGTEKLAELTKETVRLWLKAADAVKVGARTLDYPAPEGKLEILPNGLDPAVTVWGEVVGNVTLTVQSYNRGQDALDVLWANIDACTAIRAAFAPKDEPPKPEKPATPQTPPPATKTEPLKNPPPAPGKVVDFKPPETPPAKTNGDGQVRHVGDFPKKQEFVDGEVVSFNVSKVKRKVEDDKEFYQFYSTFNGSPSKYPAYDLKVYANNEYGMKAVGETLKALKLEPGKEEAVNWRYVVRVKQDEKKTRQDGGPKFYFNAVRIEPVPTVAEHTF